MSAETRNQCDGCRRGLPLRNGIHYDIIENFPYMACTAHRYAVPAAPAPEGRSVDPDSDEWRALQAIVSAHSRPAAPAPEATREADDWRGPLAGLVLYLGLDGKQHHAITRLIEASIEAKYVAERAALSREIQTLRARAEKAERRLADANETARRLCRERDALLTAARDLLNAVERGCGVGGFPPWFGDQARALAALAARAPEATP